MSPDRSTTAATPDILAALDGQPAGPGSIGHGGPVVAATPDDSLEAAHQEILAALFGAPTPGAM